MKAPDKIYLQVCGDCPLDRVGCEKCRFVELGEVTWSEEKIFDKDVEYIRKDLLLEWLNNEVERYNDKLIQSSNNKEEAIQNASSISSLLRVIAKLETL